MNPDITIVARGENPRTEKKLLGCGANKVVLPTAIGATKVAQLIIRPTAESMLEQISQQANLNEELGNIGLQFDELAVAAESTLVGKPLSNIEVHSNHGFLIVGIRRADGSILLNPVPGHTAPSGRYCDCPGHDNDIPKLAERFSAKPQKLTYRGITMET